MLGSAECISVPGQSMVVAAAVVGVAAVVVVAAAVVVVAAAVVVVVVVVAAPGTGASVQLPGGPKGHAMTTA